VAYSLAVRPRARRQLRALPDEMRTRVASEIDALSTDPRPYGAEKLSGTLLWRIRIGDYRVVYAVDDAERVVTVVRIGHRREVYRHLEG